jgi:hypothetical protein
MGTILRIAGIFYVAQAATGFAIGFSIPWLKLFVLH